MTHWTAEQRASRRNPCPVCGGTDWCGFSSDGRFVFCQRMEKWDSKPAIKYDRAGWMFVIDNRNPQLGAPSYRLAAPSLPRAMLNAVYRDMILLWGLENAGYDDILRRGLRPQQDTWALSLRSERTAWHLYNEMEDKYGYEVMSRVPGANSLYIHGPGDDYAIFGQDENEQIFWGMVRALPWEKGQGSKYRMLSSSTNPLASLAGCPKYHVAGAQSEDIWVTEGILKATVASKFMSLRVIGFSGTNVDQPTTRVVCDLLRYWGAKRAIIAFDADKNDVDSLGKNRHHGVLAGESALAKALVQAVPFVGIASWDPGQGKGIDDLLVNGGKKPEVDAWE